MVRQAVAMWQPWQMFGQASAMLADVWSGRRVLCRQVGVFELREAASSCWLGRASYDSAIGLRWHCMWSVAWYVWAWHCVCLWRGMVGTARYVASALCTVARSHTRTLARSHTRTLARSHARTLAHEHTRWRTLGGSRIRIQRRDCCEF